MLIRIFAALLILTSAIFSFGMEQESTIEEAKEDDDESAEQPIDYDIDYVLETLENVKVGSVVQVADGVFFYRPDIKLASAKTKKPNNFRMDGKKIIPWQNCGIVPVLAEMAVLDLIKAGLEPQVKPDFLSRRPKIAYTRSLAVCSLLNATKFKKREETIFFLAVNYLDRILNSDLALEALRSSNGDLANVTVICWILAWSIDDGGDDIELDEQSKTAVEWLIPNSVENNEIFHFESIIMNALDFRLSRPTAFEIFKAIMVRFDSLNEETKKLGECLLALSCLHSSLPSEPPTKVACSCIAVIRISTQKKRAWPRPFATLTNLTSADLLDVCLSLRCLWEGAYGYSDRNTFYMRKYLERYSMWPRAKPPSASLIIRKIGKKKAHCTTRS